MADEPTHLDELIRQDLVVNVPLRPLCEDACRGLCAQCGTDLNQGSCECEPERETPAEPLGRLGEVLQRELQKRKGV